MKLKILGIEEEFEVQTRFVYSPGGTIHWEVSLVIFDNKTGTYKDIIGQGLDLNSAMCSAIRQLWENYESIFIL